MQLMLNERDGRPPPVEEARKRECLYNGASTCMVAGKW